MFTPSITMQYLMKIGILEDLNNPNNYFSTSLYFHQDIKELSQIIIRGENDCK
jgi:hypothetical protein